MRRRRLVSRETVTAFAAGALLSGALAAAAWALLPAAAPRGAHPEPVAQKTTSTELPREWRWSPKGVEYEHMYGRRH